MKHDPNFTDKQFSLFHRIILLAFCAYFIVRQDVWSVDSLIFWPGAYFISLWIIGPLVLYSFNSTLALGIGFSLKRHSSVAIIFGAGHALLSFLLIVVLERFFRLNEHYSFADVSEFLATSWWYATDGIFWYAGYTAFFMLKYLYQKLEEEKEKTAQAQVEANQSQMHTLRSELSPHFLYNAMNSIAMKVRLKENKEAVSMIAALNDLLRVVLSKRQEKMVTLAEEIDILNKYISIEKIRFGDRVSIQQEFPEKLYGAKMPQLLLQPIVENAFKHGIKESIEKQEISLRAYREDFWLVFTIFNTAKSTHHFVTTVNTQGIGISNVLQRLKRIYGTHFQFQTEWVSEGIIFKISIPFQTI